MNKTSAISKTLSGINQDVAQILFGVLLVQSLISDTAEISVMVTGLLGAITLWSFSLFLATR
jgi:hypothetical protein